MTDEQVVREAWDEPRIELRYRSAGQMDSGADPDEYLIYASSNRTLASEWGTPETAWAAARAFTDAHKKKIAEVEEEIDWMKWSRATSASKGDADTRARIVGRLQAVLADLRRGWKG